ncbi:DUF5683 domain-containing protein [Flavobacterium psychrotrophum]|uniref:DUF5683 domain-containing protein n=1 Tax=Flavobacterium psychrotrophum TaxID=2294119 RepID=UPI000E31F43E|nr:DUF5683 domain-containing protein [Flavobacterium psychrotrophum]
MKNILFILAAILLTSISSFAQQKEEKDTVAVTVPKVAYKYNALAPSKAAFYSAILPGLGQIYNKSYWKAPIVWGGIGIGIYSYSFNQGKYNEYRNAYKDLLAGKVLTGELAGLDEDRLRRAQKFHQRNRDLSALVSVGLYLLNIVEANVDAHLKQFNVDDNLTLRPALQQNTIDNKYNLGLTLSYKF